MSVRAACYGEIARPGFCMPVRVKEAGIVRSDDGRETYYVSVGGKEIVKDKGATPYELEIRANEEELYRLQDLFEELASWRKRKCGIFSGTRTRRRPRTKCRPHRAM